MPEESTFGDLMRWQQKDVGRKVVIESGRFEGTQINYVSLVEPDDDGTGVVSLFADRDLQIALRLAAKAAVAW